MSNRIEVVRGPQSAFRNGRRRRPGARDHTSGWTAARGRTRRRRRLRHVPHGALGDRIVGPWRSARRWRPGDRRRTPARARISAART
jgi:hypothetical protein